MDKKDELISFDSILERAEEISGISRKELGASYDAISHARIKIYEDKHKEVFDRGGALIFQMPDHAEIMRRRETHIEKDINGNDITIPTSTTVGFAPSQKFVLSINGGIELKDLNITPVETKEVKSKKAS